MVGMADIDPKEQEFLQRLARIAMGEKGNPWAPFEALPTREEQNAAAVQYVQIKAAHEGRVAREQDHALEVERLKLEAARLQIAHEQELARLRLEQEKGRAQVELAYAQLEVTRAEVVVRAIQAAEGNTEVIQALKTAKLIDAPRGAALPAPSGEEEDSK
jgi:hypothetical protein